MEEFLVSSLKQAWPYYILAFVVGESLLYLKERKGVFLEIVVAVIICIALTVLGQYQSHSLWAVESQPVLLAVVNILSMLIPLTIFVVANQLLVRIQKNTVKHASLLTVVLVTMFIWPLWALYVVCASGLDCI